MALIADRALWCYKYTNADLEGFHKSGLLWYDTDSQTVLYQSGDSFTIWHGSFKCYADSIGIRFDCFAGRRDPRLKTTKVYRCSTFGIYQGYDYKGRFITLTNLSMWKPGPVDDTWVLDAIWSTEFSGWVIEPDGDVAPEPEAESVDDLSAYVPSLESEDLPSLETLE